MRKPLLLLAAYVLAGACSPLSRSAAPPEVTCIRPSPDGHGFVQSPSNTAFLAWGFNYDHDDAGRLLEDFWETEWPEVQSDFAEMKALGANVVRIHLQTAKFMRRPDEPDPRALAQLKRLVQLAETTGLYLDITGLGCYHKADVPGWYDAMSEEQRWKTQAAFWKAVAATCAPSSAIFCYDLMNEPILPGSDKRETDWLAGALAEKHFVQRITLDLAGRTQKEVAMAWVTQLVGAIREHDKHRMITVGVIPWVHTFPQAKPLFYSQEVSRQLDFVSVHFYPKSSELDKALTALRAYDIGKPLVIEELFPLHCSTAELDRFIDATRGFVDGWIGFYWGRNLDDYAKSNATLKEALVRDWLTYFQAKRSEILAGPP